MIGRISEWLRGPDIDWLYHLLFRVLRTRERRMRLFLTCFRQASEALVLDVGGRPYNWWCIRYPGKVVSLNLDVPKDRQRHPGNFVFVVGDSCCLPFRNSSFAVLYSNAVIEHLGTLQNQRRFAAECRRVGRGYFVHTPNARFFLEFHFLTPFVHFLPLRCMSPRWQYFVIRYGTVWGWLTRPSPAAIASEVASIRLVTRQEMTQLFPEARILTERFLWWDRSLIAIYEPLRGTLSLLAESGSSPGAASRADYEGVRTINEQLSSPSARLDHRSEGQSVNNHPMRHALTQIRRAFGTCIEPSKRVSDDPRSNSVVQYLG